SLLTALQGEAAGDLELVVCRDGGRGPEVLFEQVKLPVRLARARARLGHAPNCFLPPVRPCPGGVTSPALPFQTWPEDFGRVTGAKYRFLAKAAARSAERVIVPSQYTADDVCGRYGVPAERMRVIPEAAALPVGSGAPPDGTYVLAIGDLRRK